VIIGHTFGRVAKPPVSEGSIESYLTSPLDSGHILPDWMKLNLNLKLCITRTESHAFRCSMCQISCHACTSKLKPGLCRR